MEVVYQIFSEGGILVPEREEIERWVYTELNMPNFPVFPRFGYYPGLGGEDKEMQDGIR